MASLKKYNLSGKELGPVSVPEAFINAEANGQMIKDYITALRANARQWSANTKGRFEVVHTTKKPHPQKGTGRARQGMLSAPQYRGGGRVFGPKPKFDQHVRINRKEKKAAIRFLIGEKLRENHVIILDEPALDAPKTKTIANFLKQQNLAKRVLFLGESAVFEADAGNQDTIRINIPTQKHQNLTKSLRNIPKVEFALASNVSGYDILLATDLVITEAAFKELEQWLC